MLRQALCDQLLAFRKERDWEQFHSARNLAAALSVEASELLEHFIWASDAEVESIVAEKKDALASELADIAIYLVYLAHDMRVDLETAVERKIAVNAERYPVHAARGSSRKYSEDEK